MSTNQYPEHLNPFAEKTSGKKSIRGLKDSFKRLGDRLRGSFRRKSRDEEVVEIRRKPYPVRPPAMTYPNNTMSPALPRSRFQERVKTHHEDVSRGKNPFEEGTENGDLPRDSVSTMRRRAKKRAPLPPKCQSSQNISNEEYLHMPAHSSAWSLTSGDTDYSEYTDNQSGSLRVEPENPELTEKIVDIAKEIQKLNLEDSNNNTEEDSEKTPKKLDETSEKPGETPEKPEEIEAPPEKPEEPPGLQVDGKVPDLVISCASSSESDVENPEDYSDELVVKDITENLQNPIESITEEVEKNPEILYYEKTSLYIAGSRDDLVNENHQQPLVYTDKMSLYLNGSRDDISNNNNEKTGSISVEGICDSLENVRNDNIDENHSSQIVPKQRCTKPTKDILLGTAS